MFKNRWNILIAIWSLLLIGMLALLILRGTGLGERDLGVRCVRLMYSFEDPGELASNQVVLRELLSEDSFEQLQIDNENRAINAYYKFQYERSDCNIEEVGPGYVVYTITNDYIDPSIRWVFLYEVGEDGRLINIREYRKLNLKEG